MTYAVKVQNLSKSIDSCPILENICIRVKQGEIYGFPGAGGAGKTSLMKTLYHIIRHDCGTVCLQAGVLQEETAACPCKGFPHKTRAAYA